MWYRKSKTDPYWDFWGYAKDEVDAEWHRNQFRTQSKMKGWELLVVETTFPK